MLEIERVCQNIIERIRLKSSDTKNAFMEVNTPSDGVQAKRELTFRKEAKPMLGSLFGILGEKELTIYVRFTRMEKSIF